MAFNKEKLKKIVLSKKVIIGVSLILAIGVGAITYKNTMASKTNKQTNNISYTALKKTKIQSTINSSGAIKSGSSTNIYSNLSYNVAAINVKVGDTVKKGDVLATIDTSELQEQIAEAEQTVADNQVKAQASLKNAQENYDSAKYLYDNNLNTSIVNAETALTKDKLTLDNDTKVYQYDQVMLQNGSMSQHDVDTAKMACDKDQKAYEQDQATLQAAKATAEKELATDKAAIDSSQAAVNDKSSELALEDKKKKLQDAQVVATVDGTISNVNCEVGVQASGALFVIKDLNNLIIDADVDETDINKVAVGQKVEVTTDASKNEVIQGSVTSVQPVSTSASQSTSSSSNGSKSGASSSSSNSSSNSTSSDVSFTVEIQLTGQSDKVKVGMNSVVNIITNEKDDVYSVQYGAIITKKGQSSVYAAVQENGKYVVKEIPVTKGMESDTYAEINGADLTDGMIILSEPTKYTVGSTVDIKK